MPMKYLKIPLMDRVLSTTEWPTLTSVEAPSIYRVSDGSVVIFVSNTLKYWASSQDTLLFLNSNIKEETTPTPTPIPPAPNPQNYVTEATLLKALAISLSPALAKELI